jgi:hypothetical protein
MYNGRYGSARRDGLVIRWVDHASAEVSHRTKFGCYSRSHRNFMSLAHDELWIIPWGTRERARALRHCSEEARGRRARLPLADVEDEARLLAPASSPAWVTEIHWDRDQSEC